MSSPLLGKFQKGVLHWVKLLFSDEELTRSITYKLYTGRDEDNEAITTDFTMTAICTEDLVQSEIVRDGAGVQPSDRSYVLRSSDLPTGVTVDDLTVNDRIVDGTGEFSVIKINKGPRFVFQVSVVGS